MAELDTIALTRLMQANPDIFLCEGARRNLLWFAEYMDATFQATPFHKSYYRIMDAFAHRKIHKMIIQAPPQHGKSQCSSRFLPAFMLGLNPDLKIGLASYAATIATDFNRDVQRLIDTQEYNGAFPQTSLNASNVVTVSGNYLRNSEVFEIVNHKGSFRTVGRGGSLTSKTLDVGILDDLYKDSKEANSPVVRQQAWKWYTDVFLSRFHNDSQQLIVFTRWHKDDIIGHILESQKHIIVKNWADIENVPKDTWVVVNYEAIKTGEPTEIDERQPGCALWDTRHSLERLKAIRDINPVGFQCLYQGNPGNAEGRLYQPFKTWINKEDWGKYVRSGNYTDVADEGNDFLFSACYDIYVSENQTWDEHRKRFVPLIYALITDIEFTDANTDVTTITVPAMLNRNGTQRAWIESNNGGSQFEKVVKTKVRAMTTAFYQGTNKESRIVTNAPFVNQSIIMPFDWDNRFPKAYEAITNFLREFTANAHDDAVDGLTGIYEKEIADGNTQPYNAHNRGIRVH